MPFQSCIRLFSFFANTVHSATCHVHAEIRNLPACRHPSHIHQESCNLPAARCQSCIIPSSRSAPRQPSLLKIPQYLARSTETLVRRIPFIRQDTLQLFPESLALVERLCLVVVLLYLVG
jgi:hypothetical protein